MFLAPFWTWSWNITNRAVLKKTSLGFAQTLTFPTPSSSPMKPKPLSANIYYWGDKDHRLTKQLFLLYLTPQSWHWWYYSFQCSAPMPLTHSRATLHQHPKHSQDQILACKSRSCWCCLPLCLYTWNSSTIILVQPWLSPPHFNSWLWPLPENLLWVCWSSLGWIRRITAQVVFPWQQDSLNIFLFLESQNHKSLELRGTEEILQV